MPEVTYDGKWVLIDAYFYKFWMLRKEFDKYTKPQIFFYNNLYR
jgi:hypothetical protein